MIYDLNHYNSLIFDNSFSQLSELGLYFLASRFAHRLCVVVTGATTMNTHLETLNVWLKLHRARIRSYYTSKQMVLDWAIWCTSICIVDWPRHRLFILRCFLLSICTTRFRCCVSNSGEGKTRSGEALLPLSELRSRVSLPFPVRWAIANWGLRRTGEKGHRSLTHVIL